MGEKVRKDPLRPPVFPLERRITLVALMDEWELCQLAIPLVLPLRCEDYAGLLISEVNFEQRLLRFGTRLGGRFHVSPQTIYTWIAHHRDRTHWQSFLRRGGKPEKSAEAGRIPRQVLIEGRPAEANERLRLGDFEGDTIVSRGQRSGLVTLVDRKSRYLLAAKLKDRTARRTREKIEHLLAPLPADKRHTATFDNGKEFAEHEALARRLGLSVFFAHPYASWERGTNEHTNGLLRQYYPKGTDFADVSHYDLARTVESINHRPRKSLNYQSPSEVFLCTNPPQGCV